MSRQSDRNVVSSSSVFVLNTAKHEDKRALGSFFNDYLGASKCQVQSLAVSKKLSQSLSGTDMRGSCPNLDGLSATQPEANLAKKTQGTSAAHARRATTTTAANESHSRQHTQSRPSLQPTNAEHYGAVGLELDVGSSGASLAKSCVSVPSSFSRLVSFGVHPERIRHNGQRHELLWCHLTCHSRHTRQQRDCRPLGTSPRK